MKLLQAYRFPDQPRRVQLAIMGLITGLYLVIFLIVERLTDYPSAVTIAYLPIIVMGLIYGARTGILYAVGLALFTILLGALTSFSFTNFSAMVGGSILLILCGLAAGWIREQFTPIRSRDEEIYRTLVETSVQGLVIFQDNRVVFTNASEAALTGYSIEELLAMTPQQNLELAHPDDREFIARRLQDRSSGKPLPTRAEIRLIRKDGEVSWVEMYSATIEYGGKPAVQILTLDITERKQMEAALVEAEGLRLALGKERDLKELKSRFISMVSHQFRTPLSVINTTSYLLENYYDRLEADKRQDYFGKIRSQIDRLDELIENILTISEKEEKGLPFTPTTINLEVFCRDLVAEMQMTAEPHHKLIFNPSGDLSAATVDEKALRHILTNLLSNAIKYSPDGGDVIFDLARQNGEALFEIHDSGIGILPDDQRHLFEPFHRGMNVAGIKGNGLGLKIVKDFVDLHRGTVSCVSEPDKGTTFTVRLPIAQREDEQIQEPQNSLTPEDTGKG